MYPQMYDRDEIFFRLGIEQSDDLLQKLKKADNVDFQDANGWSYLHRACQSHYIEAIGSINENNNTILEMMLQHGLNLDKMEGDITLKEQIESFKDDEMNKIINTITNRSYLK